MYDEANILNIKGEVYEFIKRSYTGGAVDVYRPYGKNIYRYDVNSLYPTIMRNNPMPVGHPTYFEGSPEYIGPIITDPSKFSFIEVEVYCPDTVKAPLLLHRVKIGGVFKTLAPTGQWNGVYTSIEINRAIELGYKFKYIRGVSFNTAFIFREYVDYYYEMKKNSDKNSGSYTISKLMLNSLYGRFGMSPYLDIHEILDKDELIKLQDRCVVHDVIPLSNGQELVTYSPPVGGQEHGEFINTQCSLPIASAITAGARVYMSYFKNMEGFTLYYSDTDSIDISKPLDPQYVGAELGQFKLEHIFDEAVFLAPAPPKEGGVWG